MKNGRCTWSSLTVAHPVCAKLGDNTSQDCSDSSQKHVQDVPTFWENFKELFGNSAKATLATNNLILSEQNLGRIQRGEMHMYTYIYVCMYV